MTLALYITRRVGIAILGSALVLLTLGLGLDLIDSATEVLDAAGARGLLDYAVLRLPLIGLNVLPIAVLVGGSIAFLTLAARSELVIVRASGINTLRLILLLLPLALALGLAYGALSDRGAAAAERALVDRFPELAGGLRGERQIWARDRDEIVRIGAASDDGTALADVSIFQLGPEGQITARIDAAEAEYFEGAWGLSAVRRTGTGSGPAQETTAAWQTRLTPADVRSLALASEFVGSGDATEILAGLAYGARGDAFYETRVLRGYAACLIPAIMLLFAATGGFGLSRSGGGARIAAVGVSLGFLFIAADGLLLSMGASGAIPAGLAVFTAPVVFTAIGVWTIFLLEE